MIATDIRKWCAPILVLGGLALFGLAFATWGVGTEGVQPSVSGLGKVEVPGLTADDVAFLQDHTGRPGLITMVLGAVIVLAAVLSWWRNELGLAGSAVATIAGLAALVWTILTVSAPESKLFDAAVNDALDAGSSVLQPGWGLLASVFVAAVCAVAGAGVLVAAILEWASARRR